MELLVVLFKKMKTIINKMKCYYCMKNEGDIEFNINLII